MRMTFNADEAATVRLGMLKSLRRGDEVYQIAVTLSRREVQHVLDVSQDDEPMTLVFPGIGDFK